MIARPLFISPHLDDVALSCGGFVAQRAAVGDRPVVATVFTRKPGRAVPLSPIARSWHLAWGGGDVWRRRQQEDRAACKILGAKPVWLDYPDAIYRPRPEEFHQWHATDTLLSKKLARELVALWTHYDGPTVYLPLAAWGDSGTHIDHRICSGMGTTLRKAGAEVWFYEDIPYAIHGRDRAEIDPRLSPRVIDVTQELDARLSASACYGSQLESIFSGLGPLREVIQRYAGALLPGGYGERFWGRRPAGINCASRQ